MSSDIVNPFNLNLDFCNKLKSRLEDMEMEKNVDWIQQGQWVAVHGSKEKVDDLLEACYAAGISKDDLTIQEDEKYPVWCWYVCLTKALEAKTTGKKP